ncbi:MAG: hypothetical protein Q8N21_03985 [bacterium]|nr:hypothetical protein [bacterium]
MLEAFTRNKKIWLIAIFVIIILVSLFVAGGYYSEREDLTADEQVVIKEEAIAEETFDTEERFQQTINTEKEKCMLDFDLNNLDFTKSTWNSELSTMLKGLLVMRAVDQKNRDLCNYEKREIDSELRKERCEENYNFFFILTDKLKSGLDYQQYIKECRDVLLVYTLIIDGTEDIDAIRQATELECAIFYQSFQDKTPVIIEPEKICDKDSTKHDSVDYFDPQTKQIKFCFTEIADKIKFLVAVANNNSTGCLNIKKTRALQYCQYYFNKDLAPFYNKFKESYCHSKTHNNLFPLE